MQSADDLIEELGGTRVVAANLGLPLSTVSSWKERGIPARRWPAIVKLSKLKRCRVTFESLAAAVVRTGDVA